MKALRAEVVALRKDVDKLLSRAKIKPSAVAKKPNKKIQKKHAKKSARKAPRPKIKKSKSAPKVIRAKVPAASPSEHAAPAPEAAVLE
jgi:hypothetical protein